jgi:hypothetical protein
MFESSKRSSRILMWLAASFATAGLSAAYGQYPGHIDTRKKAAVSPRAIAVVEWTGSQGKPSASRIIPISVFDGEMYQPGGLYLARPEPLALESGTEYILQDAGIPQGLFDVNTAQDVQGYWFGYGSWRPMPPPPKPHKLKPAKIMPHAVGDANSDDSRPHFKNRNSSSSGGSDNQTSGQSGGGDSGSSSRTGGSNQAPSDPDRPTLRRRSSSDTADNTSTSGGFVPPGPETAIGGSDPDRPHLIHGATNPTDTDFEPPKLTGTPSDLQQSIAVSDATDRDPHPFAYSWPDPGDAAKMQAQMEALAQKALAPPAPAPAKPAARSRTAATTAHRARKPVPPVLPQLTDEHFKAYELTYSGGATLVFSAQSADATGKVRYVTLIAQPDFYGVPNVIFKSVTADDELDLMPRMSLVDAVDPKGNNRGDLIFELRGKRDRQFAIYEILSGQVQQVFTTGSLPLSRES